MRNRSFRPHAAGVHQTLGELESKIMEYLWKHGPQSVAGLHRALEAKSSIAYTTVFTELSRLLKKGLLRKRGKHLDTKYAASTSREVFVGSLVSEVLGGLLDAHGQAAIHGFIDVIANDNDALDELAKLVRERRRKPR
ncbi:MAG: hypothetical protein PVSMB1_19450 [Gemmatimonadaceae bacterium]